MKTPKLEIKGIRKSFGSTEVLHGIDLTFEAGEFVGLMGPNGAGKSTLIKILAGVHGADAGKILLDGKPVQRLENVPEVGFIHQDLGLIDDLPIVDNLRLGQKPIRRAGPILNHRRERERAQAALDAVALGRSPDTFVGELSPGEKTLVAIARAMDRGARIIFVDEATSTLPPSEAKALIGTLEDTVSEGATVVMVSHKLSEILDSTHRVVVILDGDIAADQETKSLKREELVRMLISHESQEHDLASHADPGEELLTVSGAFAGRAGPVNLSLRAGEVIGLTGLPGSGLYDIGHLANGSMRPKKGKVTVHSSVRRRAFVPPHRETEGGFLDLTVRHNMSLSALGRIRSMGLLKLGAERREIGNMGERLNVSPRDPETPFGALSGGNKQKVIFGRVLFRQPQVYVLCEPTRGVDVGTRAEIYRLIKDLRGQGAAVLVVTSDAEDLFAVCDRVGVVQEGRVDEVLPVNEMDAKELEALV